MKKKEALFIILLIVLALGIRLLTLQKQYFVGADGYYHYTVLKYGLAEGRLTNQNPLDLCPGGHEFGHPLGFYAVPYYLSFIFGLDYAFAITPPLFGVLTVVLAYFLVSLWFDRRTGIIAGLLVAVSNAHLSRSTALHYRGDNLVYPFLLLGLILLTMGFRRKDAKGYALAALAGIASGAAAMMWNGYTVVVIAFLLAVLIYLLISYLTKGSSYLKAAVAVAAQAAAILMINAAIGLFYNADRFLFQYYLPFIVPCAIAICLAGHFTRKIAIRYKIGLLALGALAVAGLAVVFWPKVDDLLAGFGSIRVTPFLSLIQELKPFTFQSFWMNYWIMVLLFPFGLFLFFKHLNKERAMLLGLMIPFFYLMLNVLRHMFIASVPLAIVCAIFLSWLFTVKRRWVFALVITPMIVLSIFLFIVLPETLVMIPLFAAIAWLLRKDKRWWLVAAIVMLLGAYAIYLKMTFYVPTYNEQYEQAFVDLDSVIPKDACFTGKMIRMGVVQMFFDRHTYYSSVAMSETRKTKTYRFFMENKTIDMGVPNLYFLMMEDDGSFLWSFNELAGLPGFDGSLFLYPYNSSQTADYNETRYIDAINNARFISRRYAQGTAAYIEVEQGIIPIFKVFDHDQVYTRQDNLTFPESGCFYLGRQYSYYFNENLCETNGVRMLMGRNITGMEKVYFKDGVMVYRLL
ncbi:MAG: STT3 domain-containing protein [Nanoarchaeota archaeon]